MSRDFAEMPVMLDGTQTANFPSLNTDRELWREKEGDFYSDSVHVTQEGGIGINCGGTVIVRKLSEWHALAMKRN